MPLSNESLLCVLPKLKQIILSEGYGEGRRFVSVSMVKFKFIPVSLGWIRLPRAGSLEETAHTLEALQAIRDAFLNCQSIPEVKETMEKLIDIYGSNASTHYSRATQYFQKGDYQQTISECSKAIELISHCPDFYNMRARAYFKIEEYDKSWKDVHKAEELGHAANPDFISELKKHRTEK